MLVFISLFFVPVDLFRFGIIRPDSKGLLADTNRWQQDNNHISFWWFLVLLVLFIYF